MPQKVLDIDRALRAKGFRVRESKDRMYHFYSNGRKTPIWTKISNGEKEIHDSLLATMARQQLKLTRRDFDRMIECHLSQAEYERLLREAGHIE